MYISVPVFQIAVTQAHLAHLTELYFSQEENWGFMAGQNLILSPCAVQLNCLLLVLQKMGIRAACKPGLSPFVMGMDPKGW